MNNSELEGFLKNAVSNLEETAKGFEGIKDMMYNMMMGTFSQVFEMKDGEGNPVYLSLKEKELKDLMESIDDYMVPLFKEDNKKEELKKCKEYKKLLQERLEEQK